MIWKLAALCLAIACICLAVALARVIRSRKGRSLVQLDRDGLRFVEVCPEGRTYRFWATRRSGGICEQDRDAMGQFYWRPRTRLAASEVRPLAEGVLAAFEAHREDS